MLLICRPSSNARPRKLAASTRARAAENRTLQQVSFHQNLCGTGLVALVLPQTLLAASTLSAGPLAVQSTTSEAYDPRRMAADRAEINQLARLMPDLEEDDLFDDGTLSPTVQ